MWHSQPSLFNELFCLKAFAKLKLKLLIDNWHFSIILSPQKVIVCKKLTRFSVCVRMSQFPSQINFVRPTISVRPHYFCPSSLHFVRPTQFFPSQSILSVPTTFCLSPYLSIILSVLIMCYLSILIKLLVCQLIS